MDGCARRALRVLCRPLSFVFALAIAAACSVLYATTHLHSVGQPNSVGLLKKRKGKSKIHVCLCSDDTDLRPAAVAIKSTFDSAAEPERLVFHYITAQEFAPLFQDLFRSYLPDIRVEVHHDSQLQDKIENFVSLRDKGKTKTREVLASPFNFAPFYLDEFLEEKSSGKKFKTNRLIYIDTDTVVLGDVGELHSMSLKGHPCAAVKYCLQKWEDFMDMEVVQTLSGQTYDGKACIANRGIMVIDTKSWKRSNITGKIEEWMVRYRTAKRLPWIGGLSQPPWLLALNGDYLELSQEWNCNSLGRDIMSIHESKVLKESGFDRNGLRALGGRLEKKHGQVRPYVVTCSKAGKMLHFNGAMKPWALDESEEDTEFPSPSCSLPALMPISAWSWSALIRFLCEGFKFVKCADIWAAYITADAACALKDFDKEWRADEALWENHRKDAKWGQEQQLLEEDRRKRAAERQREFEGMQLQEPAATKPQLLAGPEGVPAAGQNSEEEDGDG